MPSVQNAVRHLFQGCDSAENVALDWRVNMASYKQPCLQCGTYIDRDVQICPFCQSNSPFGFRCPTCRVTITKNQWICANCGRSLYVSCPHCGKQTFVQDRCDVCKGSLLKQCQNRRCRASQFFENIRCTACGKLIKS